ncbi:MAG: ATP-binding cassette domain-containing protein, partial [Pseudomonadota bacterium]
MSDPPLAPIAPPLLPLQVRALTLVIDGNRLLKDMTFELVSPGTTVIMGPNGAGKSLLLRTLHGLLQPTSGSVTWGGTQIDHRVTRRQAMVFQRPVLLRRTARDNIAFAQKTRGESDAGVIDDLLERVRLTGHGMTPARKLSGGEQQRLALARALATAPEILFLDEATASLDPVSTRIIEDIVTTDASKGMKVIFVTHNRHQAERLASDILFLSDGEVCEHT